MGRPRGGAKREGGKAKGKRTSGGGRGSRDWGDWGSSWGRSDEGLPFLDVELEPCEQVYHAMLEVAPKDTDLCTKVDRFFRKAWQTCVKNAVNADSDDDEDVCKRVETFVHDWVEDALGRCWQSIVSSYEKPSRFSAGMAVDVFTTLCKKIGITGDREDWQLPPNHRVIEQTVRKTWPQYFKTPICMDRRQGPGIGLSKGGSPGKGNSSSTGSAPGLRPWEVPASDEDDSDDEVQPARRGAQKDAELRRPADNGRGGWLRQASRQPSYEARDRERDAGRRQGRSASDDEEAPRGSWRQRPAGSRSRSAAPRLAPRRSPRRPSPARTPAVTSAKAKGDSSASLTSACPQASPKSGNLSALRPKQAAREPLAPPPKVSAPSAGASAKTSAPAVKSAAKTAAKAKAAKGGQAPAAKPAQPQAAAGAATRGKAPAVVATPAPVGAGIEEDDDEPDDEDLALQMALAMGMGATIDDDRPADAKGKGVGAGDGVEVKEHTVATVDEALQILVAEPVHGAVRGCSSHEACRGCVRTTLFTLAGFEPHVFCYACAEELRESYGPSLREAQLVEAKPAKAPRCVEAKPPVKK